MSPFEDPNKSYDIWVHGLGMTKFYFQIGMISGDTDEHNRSGNRLYRRYVCLDCLVSTEDAYNPDIGCERRKVSDVKKNLNKFLDKNAYPDSKLPYIPPEYCVSQSNGKYTTANKRCHVCYIA